jgi:hypothetical protein
MDLTSVVEEEAKFITLRLIEKIREAKVSAVDRPFHNFKGSLCRSSMLIGESHLTDYLKQEAPMFHVAIE